MIKPLSPISKRLCSERASASAKLVMTFSLLCRVSCTHVMSVCGSLQEISLYLMPCLEFHNLGGLKVFLQCSQKSKVLRKMELRIS